MKTSIVYLVPIFTMLLCSITLAQLADDLRVFPSADHQTENSITIDPTNPNNLIAASIGSPPSGGIKTPWFYSHDGGVTWEGSSNSPNNVSTIGDPFVIFNNWGDAFFISKGDPGINFFKSTNKGENWVTKSKLTTSSFADKPHVTAGISESNKSHVYAVWTHALQTGDYKVFFRKSTDRGENFGSFETVYSHNNEEGLGAYVVGGPEGNIYVAFVRLAKSTGTQTAILIYRSTDGGDNFFQVKEIDLQGMGNPRFDNGNFNHTRVNSFPYMAVDNSGTIYIVYTNNTAQQGGDIHIYLRKSVNQGTSWTSAKEVHTGQQGVRQWFPSIAIDKTDGTIYVSYYNMVSGSPNYTSYRNVATSTDGGSSFDIEQVSDVSFVPDDIGVPGYSLSFMGDYYEIAAYDGMAYPCWSDNRTGTFQAYVSPMGGAGVTIDQQLSNNNTVGNFDYWSSSEFKELEIPKAYHFKSSINHTLRGDQGIISNEKYNQWSIDNNVINHREFDFEEGPLVLISRFNSVKSGITIKNKLIEVSNIDAGNLKFKDPWFINYSNPANYQDQYGFKNLGSNAIYEWVNSPFNPNISSGFYDGVFLDQDFNDPVPYYSVYSASQDIYLTETIRTHRFYFQSWDYDPGEVDFDNPNSSSSAIVFTSDNTTITANIKGTNLSDDVKAYDNNSQRKFVRTGSGDLHSLYTSLGALWYERSTDGGQSWEIANYQNRPVNSENPKGASIDYLVGTDVVLITYQRQVSSGSEVVVDVFIDGEPRTPINYRYSVTSFNHSASEYDNINYEPVIALTAERDFLVVYKMPEILPIGGDGPTSLSGLFYSYGGLNPLPTYQLSWYTNDVHITNTGINSIHPSISDNVTGAIPINFFHLVYEDNSNIFYWFDWGQSGTGSLNPTASPINISSGTGSKTNTNPSISVANEYPVVSWTGEFKNVAEKRSAKETTLPWKKQIVVRRGEAITSPTPTSTWSTVQKTGNNVNFTNNNSMISENAEMTVITWDEGSTHVTKWFKRMNGAYGGNHSLSHSGIQTQVTDGNSLQEMTAMVFSTNNIPYVFNKSTSDFSIAESGGPGGSSKITEGLTLTYGREGIVTKGGVEFVFNIGDIFVGDSIIKFTSRLDTIPVNSETDLNDAVRTKDFHLDENSSFFFTNFYYVIHQEYADSVLTENDAVNFKAELVDAATNGVIGTYDNVTYNLSNLEEYDNIDYQVNCSGIEPGDYYLRLVTTVQEDAEYNLANVQDDNIDLLKKNYTEVLFGGESMPEVYELSQNYPNPFNPSTTIKYQLPNSGVVTLKIYDILGREVTTLVDEFKTEGRYEINFNASSLASGVYLYRLNVNDYVDVKKMMLLK